MWYALGVAAIVTIVALINFVMLVQAKKNRTNFNSQNKKNKLAHDGKPAITTCPVCHSPLQKGEEIFSKVWRPMNVPEQRIVIFGCPHCYPQAQIGITRECPRCHSAVNSDGHLVAHLFNLTSGKKHVTVAGCVKCCRG